LSLFAAFVFAAVVTLPVSAVAAAAALVSTAATGSTKGAGGFHSVTAFFITAFIACSSQQAVCVQTSCT
jgi:hypothetical protein